MFKRVVGCVQVLEVSETRTQGVLGVVELCKWLHLFPASTGGKKQKKEFISFLFFFSCFFEKNTLVAEEQALAPGLQTKERPHTKGNAVRTSACKWSGRKVETFSRQVAKEKKEFRKKRLSVKTRHDDFPYRVSCVSESWSFGMTERQEPPNDVPSGANCLESDLGHACVKRVFLQLFTYFLGVLATDGWILCVLYNVMCQASQKYSNDLHEINFM